MTYAVNQLPMPDMSESAEKCSLRHVEACKKNRGIGFEKIETKDETGEK